MKKHPEEFNDPLKNGQLKQPYESVLKNEKRIR